MNRQGHSRQEEAATVSTDDGDAQVRHHQGTADPDPAQHRVHQESDSVGRHGAAVYPQYAQGLQDRAAGVPPHAVPQRGVLLRGWRLCSVRQSGVRCG